MEGAVRRIITVHMDTNTTKWTKETKTYDGIRAGMTAVTQDAMIQGGGIFVGEPPWHKFMCINVVTFNLREREVRRGLRRQRVGVAGDGERFPYHYMSQCFGPERGKNC